jgi:hypothetical protein
MHSLDSGSTVRLPDRQAAAVRDAHPRTCRQIRPMDNPGGVIKPDPALTFLYRLFQRRGAADKAFDPAVEHRLIAVAAGVRDTRRPIIAKTSDSTAKIRTCSCQLQAAMSQNMKDRAPTTSAASPIQSRNTPGIRISRPRKDKPDDPPAPRAQFGCQRADHEFGSEFARRGATCRSVWHGVAWLRQEHWSGGRGCRISVLAEDLLRNGADAAQRADQCEASSGIRMTFWLFADAIWPSASVYFCATK